jgi:hypothetical protein
MLRFLLVILFGAVPWSACFAQTDAPNASPTPRLASLCDLKLNPAHYDGQWITVRGRVSMEFEDFTLYDQDCNAPHLPGVWLTFGGDQDEIATYCCVNGSRKKGVDVEVGGHRVPLVRDDSLREFQRVLRAQRLRRPDGKGCEGRERKFYGPVSATITGLFMAGQDDVSPGYGHLGCCHLLVIKEVSDVSAERTQVPAGGEFQCTAETWNVSPAVATRIDNLWACSGKDTDCDRERQTALSLIATHWNDHVDVNGGYRDRDLKINGDSIDTWMSDDLLTSYSMMTKKSSARLSVIRRVCVPVPGKTPESLSNPIYCQEYSRSWHEDEAAALEIDGLMSKSKFDAADAKIAEASKSILSEGDQTWRREPAENAARHALKEQAQEWGVVPETSLRHEKCEDASLPEQKNHLMACNWYSGDGTQVFWATLQKPKLTKTDPVNRYEPWMVTSIGATICH